MMKKYLYLLSTFLISFSVCGQDKNENKSVSFDSIISGFQRSLGWNPFSGQKNDSVTSSSLFRTDDFNVSISENPINFDTNHLIFKNPYYTDDYEDYDDRIINYPISYSVIYDKKLISLFENGKFVCHNLDNYSRDENYERQLNNKKFKQHWVLNGGLYAHSKSKLFGRLYKWNGNEWVKSKTKLPIDEQPILFEDDEFIIFRYCHGEWGGTIYFYERGTKNIYFTESTCANSVIKSDDKYFVLAHLGHMMGTSEIKLIVNPRELTKAKKSEIGKIKNWEALGYNSNSEAIKIQLEIFGIQLFSTFQYEDRQLFIAHLNELTFLAEINENEIQIVHPLFNDDKYTHDPITNTFGDYQLVNLDHYGTAFDREVSVIVIKGNRITLLDWNENHSH
jgi:hypothetical protein